MLEDDDELIPVKEACGLLGGFRVATYYRGVKTGPLSQACSSHAEPLAGLKEKSA